MVDIQRKTLSTSCCGFMASILVCVFSALGKETKCWQGWVWSAFALLTGPGFFIPLSLQAAEPTVGVEETRRELSVGLGEPFHVELEETGGTGYSWDFEQLDSEYFEVVSLETAKPHSSRMVGGSIIRSWLIRPKKAGRSELRMIYFRVWEGPSKAIRRFTMMVTINQP